MAKNEKKPETLEINKNCSKSENTQNAYKSILNLSKSDLEKLSYENIPCFGIFDYALR